MGELTDREKLSDRELDALVAENVTLWTPIPHEDGWQSPDGSHKHWPGPPEYSAKIESAMEAVGAMFAKDYGWSLRSDGRGWAVEVFPLPDMGYDGVKIQDETLPKAICLAALFTVGEK